MAWSGSVPSSCPPVHVIGAAESRVDAEHAVVAVGVVGDAVLDVPVPDTGGGQLQRRLDALVARVGLALGDLGLVEVHAHAEHAHGLAVGIALDHAAAFEHPAPVARARPDAVLGVVVLGLAVDVFVEAPRGLRAFVRMQVLVPARDVLVAITRIDVVAVAPVVEPARGVGEEVGFPQPDAGAPRRRLEHVFARGAGAPRRASRRRCRG